MGSGLFFSPAGLVITNNHVIEDPDFGSAFGDIEVEVLDRVDRPPSEFRRAEVVARNEVYDLAVIRALGAPVAHFIDLVGAPPTDESLMERRIRVLGYPTLGGGTITATRGIISGFDDHGNLKTDAEINPGNSGGAAFDDLDGFVGVPSFITPGMTGKIGFLISTDRIKAWLRGLLKAGLPETSEKLDAAFASSNLDLAGDNVDESNQYPRIIGKFAAVERLLAAGEYEKALGHIEFILSQRPRSALAYHYFGNAMLGLGNYVDAAERFRTCLVYNSCCIPAYGNLGITLIHLNRPTEALQVFEQILDATDNPMELWPAYNNIAQIYQDWGKSDLSALYRNKADALKEAAEERRKDSEYRHDPTDLVGRLAEVIVRGEIEDWKLEQMTDESSDRIA